MSPTPALAKLLVLARRLGLPVDDPEVVKDGSNLLVLLRPAPVVARVAGATALVRDDVLGHFRRADQVSRFLAARGVPVVEPHDVGPLRHDGLVVSFARHVGHDPDRRPDPASLAAMLAELHAELRHYPGPLPDRLPVADVDAVVDLLGRPADLVAARDALVARWPAEPAQPLHGDAHARNVLVTARGPVWNDFEDTWRGPVGWDLACAGAATGFWAELRGLFGACWSRVYDRYRAGRSAGG